MFEWSITSILVIKEDKRQGDQNDRHMWIINSVAS